MVSIVSPGKEIYPGSKMYHLRRCYLISRKGDEHLRHQFGL